MAKFTIGEVEDQARLILLDTYEDAFRFEPKEIYQALAQAVQDIRLQRPASRYVGMVLVADVEFEEDLPVFTDDTSRAAFRDVELNMERRWMEATVYYVVHKMYMKDDPDTANAGLSDKYLQLYVRALG